MNDLVSVSESINISTYQPMLTKCLCALGSIIKKDMSELWVKEVILPVPILFLNRK